MVQEIKIQVQCNDAVQYPADVLAVKYAQVNYGLDKLITKLLLQRGQKLTQMQPRPGDFQFVEGAPSLAAKFVLFMGVVPLYEFGYQQIREFSRRVLATLATISTSTNLAIETVALTIHGAGYGLDEYEAFESEVAGIVDAVQIYSFPPSLQEVVIVEKNPIRAKRLQQILDELVPNGQISTHQSFNNKQSPELIERLRSVGYTSDAKDRIFVAMPFKEEMDDVYHYGIQGAVKAAGYLCERADLSSFTGNVMEWVRNRIKSSKLVIADLTDANPNVYLEVGYAWGCGIPTILLVNNAEHLKFDVRDQRCLTYKKIKDLEESLRHELNQLKSR